MKIELVSDKKTRRTLEQIKRGEVDFATFGRPALTFERYLDLGQVLGPSPSRSASSPATRVPARVQGEIKLD